MGWGLSMRGAGLSLSKYSPPSTVLIFRLPLASCIHDLRGHIQELEAMHTALADVSTVCRPSWVVWSHTLAGEFGEWLPELGFVANVLESPSGLIRSARHPVWWI